MVTVTSKFNGRAGVKCRMHDWFDYLTSSRFIVGVLTLSQYELDESQRLIYLGIIYLGIIAGHEDNGKVTGWRLSGHKRACVYWVCSCHVSSQRSTAYWRNMSPGLM